MIRILENNAPAPPRIISMKDMEPLQVGKVLSNGGNSGNIVMRTASVSHFEVMNLTDSEADSCWTGSPDIKVELLNCPVTLVVEN